MWSKLVAVGSVFVCLEPAAYGFSKSRPAVALPSGALQAFRSSAADPWGIGRSTTDRFSCLATPLPPRPGRVQVPASGPLRAPVVTPLAATHPGHYSDKFEIIPAGWGEKSRLSKNPEKWINTQDCECEPRLWANVEFLYWAAQGVNPPPAITSGVPLAIPGVSAMPGQPFTMSLFGGDSTLSLMRPGFRTDIGYWFESKPSWGISGRFYFLGDIREEFAGGSNGNNVLSYNQTVSTALGPVIEPLYVSYPGLTNGSISASMQSTFLGGDVNLHRRAITHAQIDLDFTSGFKVLHLGDQWNSSFLVQSVRATPEQMWQVFGEDRFSTQNNFYGGQMGLAATWRQGRMTVTVQSSVALGASVNTFDETRFRGIGPGVADFPNSLVPVVPGFTSQSVQSSRFAVVPEVGVGFGWQPWEHVRFTFGYNFIYWSQVRRAQQAFDWAPGSASGNSAFWAQGITSGLCLSY